MSAGVIPPPFDSDRLLLAERADWAQARVCATARAVLLVRPSLQGDILFARGDASDALDLLEAEGRLRRRTAAEPALWLSAPRLLDMPAQVLDTLSLTAFSQWDWLSIAHAPATPVLRLVDSPGMRTRHRASVAVPMVMAFWAATWPV